MEVKKETMSKALSEGQARSIIGSFVLDTPWSEVKADLQPFIELTPEERGEKFAEFLNNGCRTSVTIVAKVVAPEIPEGKKWVREGDVIYVKVTSNGRKGVEWITYLESKGVRLSKYAQDVLLSSAFKATNGVTYTLAIIVGTAYTDSNRVSKNIRADTLKREWLTPHPETACLLQDLLSDAGLEKLGVWWIATMHEPIENSGGHSSVLTWGHNQGRWLSTNWGLPEHGWNDNGAFAFLVSQAKN
jgi:hypothetical protein